MLLSLRREPRYAILALAFTLVTTAVVRGQTTTATLSGTVLDASGSVIPGASVTLNNDLSGDIRRSATNGEGYYSISPIPPGTYTLTVEAQGFERGIARGIVLNSADNRAITTTLKVGSTSDVVEVAAAAEQVKETTGERADVLNTATLQSIAQVGRSAAEYLKIMPGMAQTGNGVTNSPGYTGETVGINGNGSAGRQSALGYYAAYGTPTASMEIMSDGAHVSDPGCNCATPVNPNGDMIQEVRLMTSAFSAENSKGPVVISTITKAGGNAFHGEGYLSARNYALNGNDWLSNRNGLPRAQNVYYFPGGNIGGPVVIPGTNLNKSRNKLFFFTGFEYFYQQLSSSQQLASVPTPAMLAGDFSAASIAALGKAGSVPGNPQPVNNAQFPGGQIPLSMLDPGGKLLVGLLPKPNANPFQTGGYNWAQQILLSQNGYQWVGRVDYSISDSTKLFVRYYHQQELQQFPITLWASVVSNAAQPFPNGVPYPTGVSSHNHSESLAGSLTHVFNATTTNEFTASSTYINFPNRLDNPAAIDPAKLGYPYHGFFNNTAANPMIPNLLGSNNQIATLGNNGGFFAGHGVLFAKKPFFSIGDNVAKVWGTHTLKFGFYGEYYANLQPSGQDANGTITESPSTPTSSGNAYADLLLGRVATYTQYNFLAVNRDASYLYEWYAQDSWKISPRFSIDLGVRLQHDGQWFDRYGLGYGVWDPSKYVNSPSAVLPGISWHKLDPSVPNPGFNTRPLFMAPRVGMAWDTFGNGKLLVRGGMGMYRYRGPAVGIGLAAPTGSYQQSLSTNAGTTLAAIDAAPTPARSTVGSTQALVAKGQDQMPLTYTYNFTIDYQLPQNNRIEVAYVGTKARHLGEANFHNVNAVPYGTFLSVANPNSQVYNNWRPYQQFADVTLLTYDGFSDYDGVQFTLNHQGHRSTYMANYTFSKVTGEGTAGAVIDTLNPGNNHGPLNFDRRHILNFAYSVNLGAPVHANKILGGVVNDWSASGTVQMQTGAPLQLNSAGSRFNLTLPSGVTNLNITGTNSVQAMPVLTCDPTSGLGSHQYLNPSCFALPSAGYNGAITEPEAFGPGFFNTDLALAKTFKFTERKSLMFRVDAFNFLNHPNYTFGSDQNLNLVFNASRAMTNSLFGTATSKTGHRILRMEAKFYF